MLLRVFRVDENGMFMFPEALYIDVAMPEYLLTVMNRIGDVELMTEHYIEAESHQHVKYWYHAVQKASGYSNPPWATNKHILEGPNGLVTEIEHIKELSYSEAPVIKENLSRWPKETADV